MEKWIVYAIISMLFAGVTSVLAKYGMKNVPSDTALTIRTTTVFIFIWINFILIKGNQQLSQLTKKDILFLCLSGLTTTISWIFYYRAIKIGNVATVATIDKASILITLLLSFIILKEPITWQVIAAAFLITAGLILLIYK